MVALSQRTTACLSIDVDPGLELTRHHSPSSVRWAAHQPSSSHASAPPTAPPSQESASPPWVFSDQTSLSRVRSSRIASAAFVYRPGNLTLCARHRPSYYGRYHRYLRIGGVGLDFGWLEDAAATVHGLHPTRCWIERRSGRSCGRVCVFSTISLIPAPLLHLERDSLCHVRSLKTDVILRFAIGIVGDAGVRGTAQQPRLFVGMILILIFAEVLGPCHVSAFIAHILTSLNRRSVWLDRCTIDELESLRSSSLPIGRFALHSNSRHSWKSTMPGFKDTRRVTVDCQLTFLHHAYSYERWWWRTMYVAGKKEEGRVSWLHWRGILSLVLAFSAFLSALMLPCEAS